MLRFVLWLAVVVLSGPARAQTAEAVQAAARAGDQIIMTGPLGAVFILVVIALVVACVVLSLVIRALWNTIKDRDDATAGMRKEYDTTIATLQERRAAELVENTKQVAQTAISGSAAITASNERLADTSSRISILAERILPVPESIGRIETRLNEVARSCGRGAA